MDRPPTFRDQLSEMVYKVRSEMDDIDTRILEWFRFYTNRGWVQICSYGWFPADKSSINKLVKAARTAYGWEHDKHNQDAWHDLVDCIELDDIPDTLDFAKECRAKAGEKLNEHVEAVTKLHSIETCVKSGKHPGGTAIKKDERKAMKEELKAMKAKVSELKKDMKYYSDMSDWLIKSADKLKENAEYIRSLKLWED